MNNTCHHCGGPLTRDGHLAWCDNCTEAQIKHGGLSNEALLAQADYYEHVARERDERDTRIAEW